MLNSTNHYQVQNIQNSRKPNHLYTLYLKYAPVLSEEAKKFLVVDFNLENELYKNPNLTQDQDIKDIIIIGEF